MTVHEVSPLTRRSFHLLSVGLAASVLLPTGLAKAVATGAPETRQMPGVIRWRIGGIEVTAISDGYVEVPLNVVPKADPAEAKRLQNAAFLSMPPGALDIAVNTYLVRTGDKLTLIDTGCGQRFGATAGKLLDNLAAVGVTPDAIDTLLLTHLHSDHVFGLTSPDGTAVFKDAEVVVHANELDFWLDNGNMSRASDYFKRYFSNAREAVAPYAKRIRKITGDEEEVISGVTAVLLPGHTPGMTGYRIVSGQDQLFVWADVVHAPVRPSRVGHEVRHRHGQSRCDAPPNIRHRVHRSRPGDGDAPGLPRVRARGKEWGWVLLHPRHLALQPIGGSIAAFAASHNWHGLHLGHGLRVGCRNGRRESEHQHYAASAPAMPHRKALTAEFRKGSN
jgi:glyoxylase-like metal-dependent hydrolase (beta-lactamase superfamily II)